MLGKKYASIYCEYSYYYCLLNVLRMTNEKFRVLGRLISPVYCLDAVYYNIELYIKLKECYLTQASLGSNLSSLLSLCALGKV